MLHIVIQDSKLSLFWSHMHQDICEVRQNIFINGTSVPEIRRLIFFRLLQFLVVCDLKEEKKIISISVPDYIHLNNALKLKCVIQCA